MNDETQDDWQIDTDIPVASSATGKTRNARAYHNMNFGDSILFKDRGEAISFHSYVNYQRTRKFGEDVRSVMRKSAEGWRVWKTEGKASDIMFLSETPRSKKED